MLPFRHGRLLFALPGVLAFRCADSKGVMRLPARHRDQRGGLGACFVIAQGVRLKRIGGFD